MHFLEPFQNYLQEIHVMNNFFKKTISLLSVSIVLGSNIFLPAITTVAAADINANNLCKPNGYVLGFFNGVWNTREEARKTLRYIRMNTNLGSTYKNEPLEYELFYNQTGSNRQGVTALEDIAEVFIQRGVELDGLLGKRWEIFWETLGATQNNISFLQTVTTTIGKTSNEFLNLMSAFYTDISSKTVAGWSYILSNPPTGVDNTIQETRIKALATEKKKLLLVAHSQGNLFANKAYDAGLSLTDDKSIKLVHVAPASPTLRGDYVLANLDLVINGLRVQGLNSVPANNAILPIEHLKTNDFSGHKMIETYLNKNRDTSTKVIGFIKAGLDNLVTPQTQGNTGFFTVTMTWDGIGDVDLHTFEPTNHVFYSQKQGLSGYLDVDNTVSNGPEHYYASCDAAKLQEGTYKIGINNYANAVGRIASLQIATATEGEIFSKSLSVGEMRGSYGNDTPIPVTNVVVTKDALGKFKVAIQ
jgi:hypothetical protein